MRCSGDPCGRLRVTRGRSSTRSETTAKAHRSRKNQRGSALPPTSNPDCKEGADGSSPLEDFAKALQISAFQMSAFRGVDVTLARPVPHTRTGVIVKSPCNDPPVRGVSGL